MGSKDIYQGRISRDVEDGDKWRRRMKASYSLLERLRNSRKMTRRMTPMQERANWAWVWMCQLLARKPLGIVLAYGVSAEAWY